MDIGIIALIAIILGSVIPTLLYLIWMWRADRNRGERFRTVARAFLAGASISVVTGVILSAVLLGVLVVIFVLLTGDVSLNIDLESGSWVFVTAVFVAPFAEELCKAGSVMLFRRRLETLETGIIIGASVGLGFAAVENILYGVTAAEEGLEFALLLIALRSVTAALGHAGYTAISGYGIAKWNRSRRPKMIWLPFYLLAVLLHGFSNLLASLGDVLGVGEWFQIACIGIILFMDVSIILLLRRRIKQLDEGAV
jgi:protease PrsW